jgi:chromosome segregation ATPase
MVLKGITFAGKGIVGKPANERSIITEVQEDVKNIIAIDKIIDYDVYSNTEGNKMTKEDQDKIDELNKKVSEFTVANVELNSKLSEMQKTIDQLNKEKDDLIKVGTQEVEKLNASLNEVNKVVLEYKQKELVLARTEKVMKKLGLEKEKASEYVEKLQDQTDSQFETTLEFASMAVSVKKPEKVSVLPAPHGEEPKKISVLEFTKKAKASLEDAKPEDALNPSVLGEQPVDAGSKARTDIVNYLTKKK